MISDADLADVITSEALTAGLDIDFDVPTLKAPWRNGTTKAGQFADDPLRVRDAS